jgi:hypothetical protein
MGGDCMMVALPPRGTYLEIRPFKTIDDYFLARVVAHHSAYAVLLLFTTGYRTEHIWVHLIHDAARLRLFGQFNRSFSTMNRSICEARFDHESSSLSRPLQVYTLVDTDANAFETFHFYTPDTKNKQLAHSNASLASSNTSSIAVPVMTFSANTIATNPCASTSNNSTSSSSGSGSGTTSISSSISSSMSSSKLKRDRTQTLKSSLAASSTTSAPCNRSIYHMRLTRAMLLVIHHSLSHTFDYSPDLAYPILRLLYTQNHHFSHAQIQALARALQQEDEQLLAHALCDIDLQVEHLLNASKYAHRTNIQWINALRWLVDSVLRWKHLEPLHQKRIFEFAFFDQQNDVLTYQLSLRGARLSNDALQRFLTDYLPIKYVASASYTIHRYSTSNSILNSNGCLYCVVVVVAVASGLQSLESWRICNFRSNKFPTSVDHQSAPTWTRTNTCSIFWIPTKSSWTFVPK